MEGGEEAQWVVEGPGDQAPTHTHCSAVGGLLGGRSDTLGRGEGFEVPAGYIVLIMNIEKARRINHCTR